MVAEGLTVSDDDVLFRESIKFKRKKKLAGNRVSISADGITISDAKERFYYPLTDISALTMVGKKKFNFYYGDKILQVKGNKRFCAIKYVHIFDGLRQIKSESTSEVNE